MTAAPGAELERLRRRLDRERRARLEAEAIAEKSLRELYEQKQQVALLQAVAAAANEAATIETAMQIALDQVCTYTGWPVGHVYITSRDAASEVVPMGIWHLNDAEGFRVFRAVTEATRLAPGVGLPGRVLARGKPLWISDVTKDPNFPRAAAAGSAGVRAGFAFPVLVGTEVVAVLEFFAAEAVEPEEHLLEVMANVGTQLGRVIERERAEEEMRRVGDAAQAANRAKSTFLANMSHELRTPLNAIIGYSEMLQEEAEDLGHEGYVPDLRKINAAGKHLLTLINDILDLSKIEAGKMDLYLERFDIASLIQDVASTIQPLLEQNGNTLHVRCAAEVGAMRADLTKVRQALFNLLI